MLGALLGASAATDCHGASGEVRLAASGGALATASDLSFPEGDVGVEAGGSYALAAGWSFGESLAIEVRWQQVFAGIDTHDAGTRATWLDIGALTAGLRYTLLDPGTRVRPWLGAQLGWYHGIGEVEERRLVGRGDAARTIDTTYTESGDTVGGNVAAGVDLHLAGPVFLELELRYHYTTEVRFLTPLVGLSFRFVP